MIATIHTMIGSRFDHPVNADGSWEISNARKHEERHA